MTRRRLVIIERSGRERRTAYRGDGDLDDWEDRLGEKPKASNYTLHVARTVIDKVSGQPLLIINRQEICKVRDGYSSGPVQSSAFPIDKSSLGLLQELLNDSAQAEGS